jgi:hypothetical protein
MMAATHSAVGVQGVSGPSSAARLLAIRLLSPSRVSGDSMNLPTFLLGGGIVRMRAVGAVNRGWRAFKRHPMPHCH